MYPVAPGPNPTGTRGLHPGARVLGAFGAAGVAAVGGAVIGSLGAQAIPGPHPPADLEEPKWDSTTGASLSTDEELAAWDAWYEARDERARRRHVILAIASSAGLAAGASAWAAGPGRRALAGAGAGLGAAAGVAAAYRTEETAWLFLWAPLLLAGVGGGVGAAVAGRLG
jgi:hypothetical protein